MYYTGTFEISDTRVTDFGTVKKYQAIQLLYVKFGCFVVYIVCAAHAVYNGNHFEVIIG